MCRLLEVYSSIQNYVYAAAVYRGEMLELVGYQICIVLCPGESGRNDRLDLCRA